MRLVLDANVIVSAALSKSSLSFSAFSKAVDEHTLLLSENTFHELEIVLYKPRLEKYFVPDDTRPGILGVVLNLASLINPDVTLKICRDPKDDMYLELAITGRADFIISGDLDLLSLSPFRGIPIVTPREFLDTLAKPNKS